MKDAMEIARQRRQDHIDEIARLEREIEKLQDKIGELETFLNFGETLINDGDAEASLASPETFEEDEIEPQAEAPAASSVPGLRSILPVDEWHADEEDDAADQSISRVLSARNG